MPAVTNTFLRYEQKYLITDKQRREIETAMAPYMTPDAFGESTVCNVYFDTPDHRIIRRSLEKPVYKEKLRLRSYGAAGPADRVFFELKKKYKGVVYKRRLICAEAEAEAYLCRGCWNIPESQIRREIDCFCSFYGSLGPAMYLSYDRSAYFSANGGDFRITFDRNILWRERDMRLGAAPGGAPLLQRGYSLMEVKTAFAMPLWLTGLLSQNAVYKTSFSKYGNAYLMAACPAAIKREEGICCA